MKLTGKRILVLSPCLWSDFYVSKHHYSLTLANLGNKVTFVEWPVFSSIRVSKRVVLNKNLDILKVKTVIPKLFFFHFKYLYDFVVGRKLLKEAKKYDVIWSFDGSDRYPMKYFASLKGKMKIFHPMDMMPIKELLGNAKFSNFNFSCSLDIISILNAGNKNQNSYFINHGLGTYYQNFQFKKKLNNKIKIGFSGNILASQVDLENLYNIVKNNNNISFEFWGRSESSPTNLDCSTNYLMDLKELNNCNFHGVLHPSELALKMGDVDGFIFCYDMNKENRGNNSHKILEYLSTGKVIISSHLDLYYKKDLMAMLPDTDNSTIPILFKQVVKNLLENNKVDSFNKRKSFALDNTYKKQIDRIEEHLNKD
jgi:hypothetical protein